MYCLTTLNGIFAINNHVEIVYRDGAVIRCLETNQTVTEWLKEFKIGTKMGLIM